MSDEAIIVRGNGTIFLGGPPLVQAATGERVSAEELGGADVHTRVSGVADAMAESEAHALARARAAGAALPADAGARGAPATAWEEPLRAAEELRGVAPADARRSVDARAILARVLDGSRFDEFKLRYGATLVAGFGRLYGAPVAVLANNGCVGRWLGGSGSWFDLDRPPGNKYSINIDNDIETNPRKLKTNPPPTNRPTHPPTRPPRPLTSEAALKGAHLVELAAQRRAPLLFLQNITGFVVGRRAEAGGIAKDGAKARCVAVSLCCCADRFDQKPDRRIDCGLGPTSRPPPRRRAARRRRRVRRGAQADADRGRLLRRGQLRDVRARLLARLPLRVSPALSAAPSVVDPLTKENTSLENPTNQPTD
jgi:acetyl-CoA carboxylase carboxyltransferase component